MAPHTVGFQLEDTGRLTGGKQLKSLAVVQRDFLEVDSLAPRLADEAYGAVQHGEIAQAEEVHLEQADFFDGVHLELRHDAVVADVSLQGDVFGERLTRYHHARRMGRGVAGHTFQILGEVQQALHLRVFFHELLQIR